MSTLPQQSLYSAAPFTLIDPSGIDPNQALSSITQVGEIGEVAGEQIDDADDAVPPVEQFLRKMRPDEAGRAGNNHSHVSCRLPGPRAANLASRSAT